MSDQSGDPSGAHLPDTLRDPEARERFRERARATLRGNEVPGPNPFIKPGLRQYPHQWNWDAAVVALGLASFDPERARTEVRSLLAGQWSDGMVPHVIYHNGASDYFPTPEFWGTDANSHAPEGVATTGLVQPPLLASCVRLMHDRAARDPAERERSVAFVREVYPKLLAWHRWLHAARDPERTGLVAIIHPWESGNDNAARWVQPLMEIAPKAVPDYERRDKRHVDPEERPLHADYERFMYLIGLFREWVYDPEIIYQRSPFLVQDTLFNAILHRAHEDLIALAEELGEPADEMRTWRTRLQRAFDYKLWDDDEGLFFAYDARKHRLLRENGCATFLPLYAGLASPEQARRLVEEHLLEPKEYAPDGSSRYLLPSQAKNHYFYEPRRYWRGPVWIIINWMVALGLERYGYADLAARMRRDSLELMAAGGFVEYYDPRDGTPAGATDFSWSAALALELLGDD